MAAAPRISVVLPVRDGMPFLDECLQSLAAQTFSDFEVVAVDDGSLDGSGELLRAWEGRDRRFRRLPCEGEGLIDALNTGVRAARARLIARMDADDRAHPERFAAQIERLEADPSLDVVSCLVSHFHEHQVAEGFRQYERWLNSLVSHDEIVRERFIESPLPHPSVIVRRRRLSEVGGYREVGWPEDYDLWLRLAGRGARFAKVPRTLLLWREHGERLTRTDRRYAVERFLACKAHHLARGPLAAAERVIVWGAGQTGRRLSKHLERLDVPLAAFVDIDPRKIGRSLRRLPIVAPEELPELLAGPGRPIVVSAVSSRGARRLIRERLDSLGLVEGRDYWCAA